MLNTLRLYEDLSGMMDAAAAHKIAEVIGDVYEELRNSVTKSDFDELKVVVRELAEAQKRTEARMEELAEAQKRTEVRMEELAEAQKRTEVRVEELAEAQKRTEIEVRALAKGLQDTRTMLGGVSDAVGYGLEDRAIKSLPAVLSRFHGIEVSGELLRRYVEYPDGRHDELNIFGEGIRGNVSISICGEAKARLSKKHISDFLKLVGRLQKERVMRSESFLLMVTFTATPDVSRFAEEHGIHVIPSWRI